jgi:hypothetical protein
MAPITRYPGPIQRGKGDGVRGPERMKTAHTPRRLDAKAVAVEQKVVPHRAVNRVNNNNNFELAKRKIDVLAMLVEILVFCAFGVNRSGSSPQNFGDWCLEAAQFVGNVGNNITTRHFYDIKFGIRIAYIY